MRKVELSPSILSADKNKIESELQLAMDANAKYIHLDVMDGKFVPEITLSAEYVGKISAISKLINDVHIMVEKPWEVAKNFIDNGANILTFHYEACSNDDEIFKTIKIIKDTGCKVGMSIKPKTDVHVLDKYIKDLDLVLIMSVEPGLGGQKYIESSTSKIEYLRQFIDRNDYNCLIEVDGGINESTSKLCISAGVDILVAGSYLYGHEDFLDRAKKLIKND